MCKFSHFNFYSRHQSGFFKNIHYFCPKFLISTMTKFKLFVFATITLMASFSINAEVLPAPQTTGGQPLMKVMSERKSSRDFQENQTVSKQDLSNMLWAAWGLTHDGKRTIATAMNRQELVLYVV